MWIKARHVPNKEGKMLRKNIPKGETCQVDQVNICEKSSKWGRNKRGIMVLGGGQAKAKPSLDGGKHPSKCKRFQVV
jgi:hypothetical protein